MSGSQNTPNLSQIVVALQGLVAASYLSEQQLEKIVAAIAPAGALTGPVAATASGGSETLPSNPAGFALVTIGASTYKVPLYNT